jgi:alpha-L-arabinofuranosidase
MNEDLYGIFFEDINYAADGGLYAELVQNRSFEYYESPDTPASSELSNPLYAWSVVERGGDATIDVENVDPLNSVNTHYLTLNIDQAGKGVGVMNSGYDGIALNAGTQYDVSLYAKRSEDFAEPITVTLESVDGEIYDSTIINGLTSEWNKYESVLSPSQSDTDARLVITTLGTDTVSLDMISLFPQDTFKNRKNGMRNDLAQVIAELEPSFLRFPGGCLVHGHGLDNAYRWKDTIGDVAERKPNFNTWGYHQSYGIGFYEYFVFSEDLNAKPLPVIPVGVSCPHRGVENAPLNEMDPWIQDALDLVEFANGPVTSAWGKIRAEMGHPEPFDLEYLGLGNEEADTPEFRQRFELVYNAIKAQYPDLTIIGTVGAQASGSDFESLWGYNTTLNVDMVDEHYYMTPDWFLSNLGRYDNYDRNAPAVFIGEYASKGDTLYNAVSEAAYLTGVERNADIVELAAYAPLLRHVDHTQWTPDLIWFDKTRVMKTVNYYVQKMYATNFGDVYLTSFVDYTSGDPEQKIDSGAVGVATWSTQAEFDDVVVVDDSGVVLFEDDFSQTDANWNVIDGDFAVVDGIYQQSGSREPDWSVTNSVMDSTSITYTLRAKKISGNEGFLIVFGYQDSGNYYWWNIGGWGNTQHAIEKAIDGKKSVLDSKSGSIEFGVWYDISIEYSASGTIRCYLNGELIHDLTLINSELSVAASRESTTGDLIIKLVNSTQGAISTTFDLKGTPIQETADLTLLTGRATARNSMDAPDTVVPERISINVGQMFDYKAPPMSVQVMRIKTGD